tara:strand:+ start:21342 stop:21719 length:378 start_codon:yes stop_codon:yes gene_type:complete
MSNYRLNSGVIHVHEVNLWAHVGVLEHERLLGQEFIADFRFWLDLDSAAVSDELSKSIDYSHAIKEVQKLSFQIHCLTIEKYSDQILDCLEELYGSIPMSVLLRKCSPPVSGFSGSVSVERWRNF